MRIERLKLVDVSRFRITHRLTKSGDQILFTEHLFVDGQELGEVQIGLFMTGGNGNADEWVLFFDDCREPVHGYDIVEMAQDVMRYRCKLDLEYDWSEIMEVLNW